MKYNQCMADPNLVNMIDSYSVATILNMLCLRHFHDVGKVNLSVGPGNTGNEYLR